MENQPSQGKPINMKKISKWAKWPWINTICLIILCLKKPAPKLLRPKKQMETKYSCKVKIKNGQKVEAERNRQPKRKIIKKNIIKLILSRMKTSKWNMDPMAQNLLETMTNRPSFKNMENGNTNSKK